MSACIPIAALALLAIGYIISVDPTCPCGGRSLGWRLLAACLGIAVAVLSAGYSLKNHPACRPEED